MTNQMLIPQVGPIQPKTDAGAAEQIRERSKGGPSFDNILRENLVDKAAQNIPQSAPVSPLKFSAHAMDRIRDRGIDMSGERMSKLEKAVQTAAQKGSKDSLILTNDAAFVVSVKNRTVITVLDRNQMNGNVFTNIDSTVVV